MSWFLKVNVSVLIMDMTHCLLSIIACNIKMYHIIFIKVNLCVYDYVSISMFLIPELSVVLDQIWHVESL